MKEDTITTQLSASIIPDRWHEPAIAEILSRVLDIADFAFANAAAVDHHGAFPAQEFELIAQAGLLTAPLPRNLGGLGLGTQAGGTLPLLLLLKQLGRGNLSVGRVYEGHVNALQIINTFGTPEQVEVFAETARDRQKIFGVWNAEAADGVKVIPLDNGNYRLEGSKTFASGCGFVERPFVNGVLPDGSWQMCIVPMDEVQTSVDPAWWQPSGMRASASYKVDFTGVELASLYVIGNPGDYFRQPWLTGGVIRFAAVQLGGAEALFNLTREYLQSLNRTKDPYQEERLGQMAIAIESGHLWLRGAATLIDEYAPVFGGYSSAVHPQASKIVAYGNMVRTAIEQICMNVIQLCERCVGTRGLLPPNPIERVIRDLSLYLRQPAFDAAIANVGQYALANEKPASSLWML